MINSPLTFAPECYYTSLPEGNECVAMIVFQDTLYVALTHGVWRLNALGDRFDPVKFDFPTFARGD